jgi:uncharacterized protein (DUF1015 family)
MAGDLGYDKRPVPTLRPFRALRYDPAVVGSLAAVISPPYDVIGPALQAELAARHARNSVLLDLPPDAPGDAPGERYRRAAAAFAAWRAEGTLRLDPEAAVYVYEQTYRLPGTQLERSQRGFFARLQLEAYGPDSSVLPHERTLGGPKEDRHALLTATGANLSAMVGLYRSPHGESGPLLAAVATGRPVSDLVDDDGVRHRLWLVPAGGAGERGTAELLIALAEAGPITIADGHHRYETALRYRDERVAAGDTEPGSPWAFMLVMLFDIAATEMTILPTHRVVHGQPDGEGLLAVVTGFGDLERLPSAASLVAAFAPTRSPSPRAREGPRVGIWSGGIAAIFRPSMAALGRYLAPGASAALRGLGVSQLEALLGAVYGLGRTELAAGGSVDYVRDAAAACAAVDAAGAGAAFLLEPIVAADLTAIAAGGEVMPQKSTYFYPKPATGLLFSPAEW